MDPRASATLHVRLRTSDLQHHSVLIPARQVQDIPHRLFLLYLDLHRPNENRLLLHGADVPHLVEERQRTMPFPQPQRG